MCQIDPRGNQHSACRKWEALIAKDDEHAKTHEPRSTRDKLQAADLPHNHTATSRVTSQNDTRRFVVD